nr:MAG TPA: hypothetical protein [Caudoviricetes sp.]
MKKSSHSVYTVLQQNAVKKSGNSDPIRQQTSADAGL